MRRKSFTPVEERAYKVSNRVLRTGFRVTPSMRRKVGDLAVWLAEGNKGKVKETTQAVLDLLCVAARVPSVRVTLHDRAPAEFRGDKAVVSLYGLCAPDGTITLAFRTAVLRKVIAFRTYVSTLVHEFMHHYDRRHLGLGASFHTRGFYLRVRSLQRRLLPVPLT